MYQIHYCEFARQNDDNDIIYRPYGSEDWLFLLFLSPMRIKFSDKHSEIAESGGCILYSPGAYQNYRAVSSFRNSYVHFAADTSPAEEYNIPVNRIFYPSSADTVNSRFKLLQEEYLVKGLYYDEMADILLRNLFITASRQIEKSYHPSDSILTQFQQARLTFLSRCEENWNIDKMCKLVNLGKSQFYQYYHDFFGTSPKDDLLSARIDRARNLLTNKAIQVQQASALCGFKSVCHFTRYFKAMCGYTPGEYRKKVSEKNIY